MTTPKPPIGDEELDAPDADVLKRLADRGVRPTDDEMYREALCLVVEARRAVADAQRERDRLDDERWRWCFAATTEAENARAAMRQAAEARAEADAAKAARDAWRGDCLDAEATAADARAQGAAAERADVLAYVRSRPPMIDRWLAEHDISNGCHERMAAGAGKHVEGGGDDAALRERAKQLHPTLPTLTPEPAADDEAARELAARLGGSHAAD